MPKINIDSMDSFRRARSGMQPQQSLGNSSDHEVDDKNLGLNNSKFMKSSDKRTTGSARKYLVPAQSNSNKRKRKFSGDSQKLARQMNIKTPLFSDSGATEFSFANKNYLKMSKELQQQAYKN